MREGEKEKCRPGFTLFRLRADGCDPLARGGWPPPGHPRGVTSRGGARTHNAEPSGRKQSTAEGSQPIREEGRAVCVRPASPGRSPPPRGHPELLLRGRLGAVRLDGWPSLQMAARARACITNPNDAEGRRRAGFSLSLGPGWGVGWAGIKGERKGAETKITRPLIFHYVKGMKRNHLQDRSFLAPQVCCPPLTSKAPRRSWLMLLAQYQAVVYFCLSVIFFPFSTKRA